MLDDNTAKRILLRGGPTEVETKEIVWKQIRDEKKALEDKVAALKAALAAFEWRGGAGGSTARCPWCGGWERHPHMDEDYFGQAGHKADCARQLALAD